MFTKRFWKDAAERAVKTLAQTVIGVLAVDTVRDIDLEASAIVVGVAVIVSVCTSLVSSARDGTISPASVVKE